VDVGGLEPRGERLAAQHTASSNSTLASDPSGECMLAALPTPSRDFRPALKHQYGKLATFFDNPEHTTSGRATPRCHRMDSEGQRR
jgi:hypothetical protein